MSAHLAYRTADDDAAQTAELASPAEIFAVLQQAAAHLQAGRTQAVVEALQILAPSQVADAAQCRLIGAVLLGNDGPQPAFGWYERAYRLSPQDPDIAVGYATLLFQAGRLEEALSGFDAVLRTRQSDATSHFNRGLVLRELGRTGEAITALDQALKLDPTNPAPFRVGGLILRDAGRYDQALTFFKQALRLRPHFYECQLDHANVLLKLGRFEAALEAYDQALALFPNDADLLNNRGAALRELGQLDAALIAFEAALAVRPAFPRGLFNRGTMLLKRATPEAALASYDAALALKPVYPDAHVGRGVALKELGRFDEALAAFDTALAQDPASTPAKNNKGALQLLHGDFAAGLEGYEYRWVNSGSYEKKLDFPIPQWSGPNAAGARVLVYDEQGFGDTFQFCRYLPLMADAGVKVTFFCRSMLRHLIGRIDPRVRVVDYFGPEEIFDAQIALSSLPRAFGTRVETIPTSQNYLTADPEHVARWRNRLGTHGFKVGLCWQGNLNPQADPRRSIPLEAFAPLAAVPGVRLISLQKADAAEISLARRFDLEVAADFDSGRDAFFDCAAVMGNLDLVITCDTSIAHLAGALGCPVFVLLKQIPEWRWLLDREDSPWYPTMRLFRQKQRGDWAEVMTRVAAALGPLGSPS
jgi:tetratricopeptide (TPR) repeat protein